MIGAGGVSPVSGSAQGDYPQYHGIFYGAVSSNADPLKKNRCTLRVPQLLGSAVTTWAMPLTPLVDPPKVGALVAVMFSGGDLDNPVYLVVYPAVPIENVNGNVQPVGTAATAGTSHKVAAADHVHTLANALESVAANIQPVTASQPAAAGASAKASRADHVHGVSGLLGAGTSGFLEITSSLVNGSDSPAVIDMYSRFAAGQTEIDLTATNINLNGRLSVGGYVIGSQATPSIGSVAHNPNDPTYGGAGGTGWASGERAALDAQVDVINQNFANIAAALQAAGIWH